MTGHRTGPRRPPAGRATRTSCSCGVPRRTGPRPCAGLPGAHRVPRRGARQPDRVGRLGRHDRARAPGAAAPPPERHLVARAARDRPRRVRRRAIDLAERRAGRAPRAAGPTSGRSGLAGEQPRRRAQAVEVVHVAGQRRHDGRRHPRVRRGEPLAAAARSRVDDARRGRRAAAAAPRSTDAVVALARAARPRPAPAPRSSSARAGGLRPVDAPGPASGIRSSLSRSTKYAASRSASGSGAATTRNAVPAACSSCVGLLGPLPEAAEQRVERGDEGLHVAQHLRRRASWSARW